MEYAALLIVTSLHIYSEFLIRYTNRFSETKKKIQKNLLFRCILAEFHLKSIRGV